VPDSASDQDSNVPAQQTPAQFGVKPTSKAVSWHKSGTTVQASSAPEGVRPRALAKRSQGPLQQRSNAARTPVRKDSTAPGSKKKKSGSGH
jgi:hypothetical protein